MGQLGVTIVKIAGEAGGYPERRRAVTEYITVCIVSYFFDDVSVRISDGSEAAYLIVVQVVSVALFVGHGDWHSAVSVLKTVDEIVVFVIDDVFLR